MIPELFPQANCEFKAPNDLDESQCATIPAYKGVVRGGSCDGSRMVVVCWRPDARELEAIKNGAPIFLMCMGGLPPHCVTTSFEEAINIA